MKAAFRRIVERCVLDAGQVSVEYAVLLALIVTLGLASILVFGDLVEGMYLTIVASVGSA